MTPCSFCGGAFHPATGCTYSPTCFACCRCVKEFWRWVKGHTNRTWKTADGKRVSFYEAAGKKP